MAISFDSITHTAYKNSTVNSQAHTFPSGSYGCLIGIFSTIDNITSVTVGGDAATLVDKLLMTGAAAGQYIHLYHYEGSTSGSRTVTVNSSSGLGGYFSIATYNNVNETGQPDASNKGGNSSATSLTVSLTTTENNCWLVGFAYTGATMSAGTGTTLRGGSVAGILSVIDSNGGITPAGSAGLTVTHSSNFDGMVMASFSPVPSAGGTTFRNNMLLSTGL